jgi:hypothetical protein
MVFVIKSITAWYSGGPASTIVGLQVFTFCLKWILKSYLFSHRNFIVKMDTGTEWSGMSPPMTILLMICYILYQKGK